MLTTALLSLLLVQAPANTDTQAIRRRVAPLPMPAGWTEHIDQPGAEVPTPEDARGILMSLPQPAPSPDDPDAYYIIHVVRWSAPDAASNTQTVEKQHWYVFRGTRRWTLEEFAGNRRLYGARRLGLLSIQLNCDHCGAASLEYRIDVRKKTPANVGHLFDAVQLAGPAGGEKALPPERKNFYALIPPVDLWYRTADISVVGMVWSAPTEKPGALNTEAEVFDNEGLHRWDVSVAVPIRSVKQLQFDAAGGTVAPSAPKRSALLAVFDLYPAPTDIKRTRFNPIPYVVVGVGVSGHPLDRILLGAGVGPAFAQFYVGVLLEKIQPADGATATGTWWHQRDKQFAFGVNLPVRAIKDALKKSADGKAASQKEPVQ